MTKSLDEIFNKDEINEIKQEEKVEKELNEVGNNIEEEKGEFEIDTEIANFR